MKTKSIILLVILSWMWKANMTAQVSLDAEFRPRTEFRQGFRKPLADTLQPGIITLQRTRFNASYKSKILNAGLSLQDARIWGNSDTKTNTSKIEINEAWFEYLLTSGLSAKIGRQSISYDDKRLFSTPEWSNTGTSHDALVLKYKSPVVQIQAGFAYNDSKDTLLDYTYSYTPKQNCKTLNYLWASKEIYSGLNLSLIGVMDGFQKKTNPQVLYERYTYGGNLVYAKDSSDLAFTLTAYGQKGIDPNKAYGSKYASLSAFLLAAKVSYKITDLLTPVLGVDYYSGSSATIDASKSNTFNRLYGAPHSFNGYMEYFQTLPTQGLIDYYATLASRFSTKCSTELTSHLFYFDKDFIYNNIARNKNLGTELDFTLKYSISKEIALQAGYSIYFNSSTTTRYYKMAGVDIHSQQWAYVMFTVRPNLYKTPVESK